MVGPYSVAQAVQDTQADMNTVQAAADAINDAIKKVEPWLTPETWRGQAATDWADNWKTVYHGVQSWLTGDLQPAENEIVSAVRTQMTELVQRTREAATA